VSYLNAAKDQLEGHIEAVLITVDLPPVGTTRDGLGRRGSTGLFLCRLTRVKARARGAATVFPLHPYDKEQTHALKEEADGVSTRV
jgi:hypothetical protein